MFHLSKKPAKYIGKSVEDGSVTAFGTHAELYSTCPSYQKMVELQRLEEGGAQDE